MSAIRRSLMFAKATNEDFIEFEDKYIKDICCYYRGVTTPIKNGQFIMGGVIEGSGDSVVSSDYLFLCNAAIPAHPKSKSANIPSVSASRKKIRIDFTISGSSGSAPWDIDSSSIGSSSIVFQVQQYTANNFSASNVAETQTNTAISIDGDTWNNNDWNSNTLIFSRNGNVWSVRGNTASGIIYVKINIKAKAGIVVNYSVYAEDTINAPAYITTYQAEQTTAFPSNCFYNNKVIKYFDELKYFGLTENASYPRTSSFSFSNTGIEKLHLSDKFTYMATTCINDTTSNPRVVFDNLTYLGSRFTSWQYPTIVIKTNSVCVATALPTNRTSGYKVYVPDALVDSYKVADTWSRISSLITPISQYATDYPDDNID